MPASFALVAAAGMAWPFSSFGRSAETQKQPALDPSLAKYFAQKTWSPLNATARGKLFMELAPQLGIRCPKIGMGYFYYPSLRAELRGAVATANIARGEEVCFVPVQQMLSEFAVGNSSLVGLMRNYISRSPRGKASTSVSVTMKAVLAIFAIREGARESSRWMPYLKGALDQHSPHPIPTTWKKGDARLEKLSGYGQKLAMQSRARTLRQHAAIFPDAFAKYGAELGEGVACGGRAPSTPCSRAELEQLYSQDRFVELYSVLRARDWVLDMHGEERPFLAPVVDFLNFGQVGIRASYDDKRGGFVARTVQPIQQGKEILFYYGNFCIDDAVNMYGFAPPTAPQCKAAGGGKKIRKAKSKRRLPEVKTSSVGRR